MGTTTDALARALAAEDEAVFGYGVLGPHLDAADASTARDDQAAHEALRDTAQGVLAARRAAVPAPQADYPDLYPVRTAGQARVLAVRLETQAASAWRAAFAAAVAASPVDTVLRDRALAALTDTALRATRWRLAIGAGPATVPFPGL